MNTRFSFFVLLLSVIALVTPVHASLTFEYTVEYSGATNPVGDPPWLSAAFEDHNDNTSIPVNEVRLTLTAVNLTSSEFVSDWYFNIDPLFDTFIPPSGSSIAITYLNGIHASGIQIGKDAFKASGDCDFDILISFPTSNDDPDLRFSSTDTATFKILFTGDSGLTLKADSFNFLSVGGGGTKDGLYTVAHVQGIPPDDSGLVTTEVPVPGAVWLLGSGLLGLLIIRRRRSR